MTQSKKPPTREEVWKMFRKIDLTPYHDDKNGLTYVPWARAWSIAMDHIGEHMTVKWHGMTNEDGTVLDYIKAPSGTASVCCSILVGGVPYSECTLAVMDYRNKPIVEPTSVDLQNSRQRCRTKALAELGLGLYLWENNGEWEGKTPAKPKKAVAKKRGRPKKKVVEKTEEAVSSQENGVEKDIRSIQLTKEQAELASTLEVDRGLLLVDMLVDKCKELYEGGWEPDEVLKAKIKEAVRTKDAKKIDALLSVVDTMGDSLLKLHNDAETQGDAFDG